MKRLLLLLIALTCNTAIANNYFIFSMGDAHLGIKPESFAEGHTFTSISQYLDKEATYIAYGINLDTDCECTALEFGGYQSGQYITNGIIGSGGFVYTPGALNVASDLQGFYAAGVYKRDIGYLTLGAKVGLTRWQLESRIRNYNGPVDDYFNEHVAGTGMIYGVFAAIEVIGNISTRVDYLRMNIGSRPHNSLQFGVQVDLE